MPRPDRSSGPPRASRTRRPAAPPAIPTGRRLPSPRTLVVAILGAFAAAMAYALFVVHRVPLYGVETDLFGEYIPAARALLAGAPTAAPYEFKGPGYPLLLALSTAAALGDAWLGARILNLVAALAGAFFTYVVVRRAAGEAAALFVLAALCANPLYVRSTFGRRRR